MKKIYFLLLLVYFGFFYGQNAGIYKAYVAIETSHVPGQVDYYWMESGTGYEFDGSDLGTFSNTDSILLKGGQLFTWKNASGNILDNNYMYFTVYPLGNRPPSPVFTPVKLPWKQDGVDGNPTNQLWENVSGNANLIASQMVDGVYVIEVYMQADADSEGIIYLSNGGNNYKATFTIDGSLGVEDLDAERQNFVAKGKLYTAYKGRVNLKILDYSGRVLSNTSVEANGQPIDLHFNQKGQYILVVSNDKSRETVKFIQ